MVTRKFTNKIIELVDEGAVDRDALIRDLMLWMDESDVEAFYDQYLADAFEEDEDEYCDLDGPDEQSAWYDTSAELM